MDQTTALNILKSGKNVFLTGQAGSGKTYVINAYVRFLWACNIRVAVTASTGIAATHIGGVTIHSRSGIGIKESLSQADIELISQKEHIYKGIYNTSVLIIDEVSMLSANTLDMVNRVVQEVRGDRRAFGGMQVIFCGDFFQLPPVTMGVLDTKRFAFASSAWKQADLAMCYLDTQYRQNDSDFSIVLNQLRTGQVSQESIEQLQTRLNKPIEAPGLVKLYTHNIDVDRINQEHLEALDTEERSYKHKEHGDKKLLAAVKKGMLAPETLTLKIGAQVIFIKNNPNKGYWNGTTGVVVGYEGIDKLPLIKTKDSTIKAEPEMRSIENAREVLAHITQIPLKLARAITVHKSQGMTLDAAEMDLSKTFESGQAYVALSRVRSLEGLSLLGLNINGLDAHPLVVRADKYFREQSELVGSDYSSFTDEELTLLHKTFVTTLKGEYNLNDEDDSRNGEPIQKTIRIPKPKVDTLALTLELILQGKSLEEIAQERGLVASTIMQHVYKIKQKYPDVNLDQFKPEESILMRVYEAHNELKKNPNNLKEDGSVGLKALFEKLNGDIQYDMLKLAMMFV